MKKYRKAINFDLDTKKLKEIYSVQTGKKFNAAYYDIKKFMKENGFSHRQGSGYISKLPMSDTDMVMFIEKLQNKFPWISPCSNKIDGTEINAQFNLKMLMATENIELQKNVEETKKEDITKNTSQIRNNKINTINQQETITISKAQYDTLIKSFEAAAKHAKTIFDFNQVLNEHPDLKEAFKTAKAETLQRAQQKKGGLNDKNISGKIPEHKPKHDKPKR